MPDIDYSLTRSGATTGIRINESTIFVAPPPQSPADHGRSNILALSLFSTLIQSKRGQMNAILVNHQRSTDHSRA